MNLVGKNFLKSFVFLLIFVGFVKAENSWDSEKLALEITMQQRVETAIGKILPAGEFVVVVRIDALSKELDEDGNFKDDEPGFYLPGVPVRSSFDGSVDAMNNLADSLKPNSRFFKHFVRRVSATLVVDEDVSEAKIEKIRELAKQILGLNPRRGDTLDIQTTTFNKPSGPILDQSSISRLQRALKSYWVIISLSIILFCIALFVLFIFGPLRGFLNRFVQVLPTLKGEGGGGRARFGNQSQMDPQILPAMLAQAQAMGLLANGPMGPQGGPGNPNFQGSLMVENPNKKSTPFGFIREDHLSNLATLLMRETPEKAAVVLGYLPPEWISRVLSKMDPDMQSSITDNLATTRQLLPEQVEDIEQDLKRRLDYLIGGPDRIIAVYESLDPESQKKMLDNLRVAQPELAEELRQRTFLFEDLDTLDEPALKTVLREVELQTLVLALRGKSDEFRENILNNLSSGKAEIVKEELDFSDGPPGRASHEAQRKIAMLVRRLEKEGQIQLPRMEEPVPLSRYGASLKSSLKLSEDMEATNPSVEPTAAAPSESNENIEQRIRDFMNRQPGEQERFPMDNDDDMEPPHRESA